METVKDWKLWFLLMFNICASVPSQAFSVFMPMVVQGLGYSSVEANLVHQNRFPPRPMNEANPCYRRCLFLLLCAVLRVCTCSRSTQIAGNYAQNATPSLFNMRHRQERGYHILAGISVSLIGLVVTVTTRSHGAQYVGLCILLFGSYVSAPLTVVWLSGNNPGMSPTNPLWSTFRTLYFKC